MNVLFLSKGQELVGGPYAWKKILAGELSRQGVKAGEIKANPLSCLSPLFIGKILELRKADVVCSYVSNQSIVLLLLFAKLFGKPVVYACHGNIFKEHLSKRGLKKHVMFWNYYLLLKLADITVFPSKFTAKNIAGHFRAKNPVVVHNGTDFGWIESQKPVERERIARGIGRKDFVFLSITSFTYREKCAPLPILFNAFRKFQKKHKNSWLVVIGDGAFRNDIEKSKQSSRILFAGKTDKPCSFTKACDVFVHITGLDNFPYSIIEAMYCKKPIIASRVGGIPEASKKITLVENSEGEILRALEKSFKKRASVSYPEIREYSSRAMALKFLKALRPAVKKQNLP